MKNEFWIYCRTKKCFELVIDIYDPSYMEQPREKRFGELKSLLSDNIMEIRRVYIQWEDSGYVLEMKKAWCYIERIVEIHKLLEKVYAWLTPWHDKNPLFKNYPLVLDENCDNSRIPHYKLKQNRPKTQRNKHKEGEVYTKDNGELYVIVYNTERRVCDLVWEAFQGEIPYGARVSHIDGNKQNNRLDNLKLVGIYS